MVQGGKVANIAGQDWIFPSGTECIICHTPAAEFSLGLEVAQLNGNFTYPSTGRTANQLATLDAIAMFDSPFGDPAVWPVLADPDDVNAALGDRARAYLHTNCAQCHRPGGPAPTNIHLLFDTALASSNTCNIQPQSGNLGIANARIIAPGDPDRSVLVERINRRDVNGMPPLASNLVHSAGVTLISDWIARLSGC